MESKDAVSALSALAQENRLDVFRLLVQAGPDGMSAGTIAERLRVPAPTLSFHLAQLRQAGLVTMQREGRSLIYTVDFDGMNGLMGFLTANCCSGNPELCAPPVCAPAPRKSIRKGVVRT